jgi:HlyD family secretion protein
MMTPATIRRVVLLAALVGVAAAGLWALRPAPVGVEVAHVVRGDLEATVSAEGKTRVKDLFTIAAPVDGELERIALRAGDVVSRSIVVARVWPAASRPLDPRSQAEATAAMTAARAAVRRAEAAEREAIAALSHAESSSRTSATLAKQGVVAAKDAEHAGHQVDIRREAVQVSQSALAQARAELVRAEASAGVPATGRVRQATEVRSPAVGRVLRVRRESAGPVAAGTPLLDVGNTTSFEIVADFLTTDAMAVEPGARAEILDWGGSQPLEARVRHVEPGAFTKISALGLEEQRVPVVLDLVGKRPATFGHDFHVKVAVVVWRGTGVLVVPSTALFRAGDRWAVFVVRDGRARLTEVTAGRSDDARTVIERGLNAGEQIVVQPSDALRDGKRVRMTPPR